MIIMGMISAQSVNLANIADHVKQVKKIKYESLYKRIQRFFVEFALPFDDIARFIFGLFEFEKCDLIIDRTNWWFGEKPINYLMLSVRYKNVSVPLFWFALKKCGNSPASERIAILKRFVNCFGKAVIGDFCGDREFACIALLKYLLAEAIPFTLGSIPNPDLCVYFEHFRAEFHEFNKNHLLSSKKNVNANLFILFLWKLL